MLRAKSLPNPLGGQDSSNPRPREAAVPGATVTGQRRHRVAALGTQPPRLFPALSPGLAQTRAPGWGCGGLRGLQGLRGGCGGLGGLGGAAGGLRGGCGGAAGLRGGYGGLGAAGGLRGRCGGLRGLRGLLRVAGEPRGRHAGLPGRLRERLRGAAAAGVCWGRGVPREASGARGAEGTAAHAPQLPRRPGGTPGMRPATAAGLRRPGRRGILCQ